MKYREEFPTLRELCSLMSDIDKDLGSDIVLEFRQHCFDEEADLSEIEFFENYLELTILESRFHHLKNYSKSSEEILGSLQVRVAEILNNDATRSNLSNEFYELISRRPIDVDNFFYRFDSRCFKDV